MLSIKQLLITLIPLVVSAEKIERVLFLGLDGAGSFHTQINTPNVNALLQSGVYTDVGAAMDPTFSGENWGSMLHGVVPSKHGLNNYIAESKPYPEDSEYPSIFKIIHQNDPSVKMASFAAWNAINEGIIELSVPMHRVKKQDDDQIIGDMINYLRTEGASTKLTFFYFGDIDNTGHKHGYNGAEYRKRYTKTDGYIKQILTALEESNLKDSTLVIIATDHGGIFKVHGGITQVERSVLWGMSGPGIPQKGLKAKSVRNMDMAAIILKSLNVPVPEYFDAKYPQF